MMTMKGEGGYKIDYYEGIIYVFYNTMAVNSKPFLPVECIHTQKGIARPPVITLLHS